MSVFGVILVRIFSRIFPHSDWIRRDTEYISVFSQKVRKCEKNADKNNSKYGQFLRSAMLIALRAASKAIEIHHWNIENAGPLKNNRVEIIELYTIATKWMMPTIITTAVSKGMMLILTLPFSNERIYRKRKEFTDYVSRCFQYVWHFTIKRYWK